MMELMADEPRLLWKKSKYAIGKTFDQKLAEEIISRMKACEDLAAICRDDHMPRIRAIAQWRKDNTEFNKAFVEAYHAGRGIVSRISPGSGPVSIRTDAIEEELLARLESGELLAQICRLEHMPKQSTVYDWMHADQELAMRVARARVWGAASIQAECIDIADDGRNDFYEKIGKNGETFVALDSENIQRSKLRIETRKWLVGTLDPRLKDNPSAQQVKINVNTPEVGSITIGEDKDATTPEQAFEEYQRMVKGE